MHVCLTCINHTSGNPLAQRLRLDVDGDRLSCAMCKSDAPVVAINMLGRLLRVGASYFHFCQGCNRVQPWAGGGLEFAPSTCQHQEAAPRRARVKPRVRVSRHCARPQKGPSPPPLTEQAPERGLLQNTHNSLAGDAVHAHNCTVVSTLATTSLRCSTPCAACSRPNTCNVVHTPHVPARRFVSVYLCNRHRVPEHLAQYIYDTATLRRFLLERGARG